MGPDDRAIARVRAVLVAVGVVTASLGGAVALGLIGAPSVVGVENRFGDVDQNRTMVLTDLTVSNPNPIGVRLGDTTINYTVYMNDVEMANGSRAGLQVESGNSTLPFETRMRNNRIPPWWVSHIRNDEVTNVTIDATIRTGLLGNRSFDLNQRKQVETDIIGAFASDETRPVKGSESPIYNNPVLYINSTDGEWGEVSDQETPIAMEFVVYNPQLKPYTITEVGYEMSMNNISMGEGATEETYIIPGQSTETIRTTPVINNRNLDDWWVSHLQNDQRTTLRIDFYAKVELPTGDEIRVPLNRLTYEQEFETDIFGTKNGSRSGGGPTDATATLTPTGTDTDDGLLGGDEDTTPADTDDGLLGNDTTVPNDTPGGDDTPVPDGTPTETDGGLIGSVLRVVPI